MLTFHAVPSSEWIFVCICALLMMLKLKTLRLSVRDRFNVSVLCVHVLSMCAYTMGRNYVSASWKDTR